ncbi:hypothetical protein D9C73_015859 [Collichthys lucidus]|uniref:Uncharacterized protein n=1 Tax=Collichthys lucidus TaxID=240159 RepID=A0A4U5V236_COLLU|nr:hypothetical protein D9C73_015859 [Collichthys lucidus]
MHHTWETDPILETDHTWQIDSTWETLKPLLLILKLMKMSSSHKFPWWDEFAVTDSESGTNKKKSQCHHPPLAHYLKNPGRGKERMTTKMTRPSRKHLRLSESSDEDHEGDESTTDKFWWWDEFADINSKSGTDRDAKEEEPISPPSSSPLLQTSRRRQREDDNKDDETSGKQFKRDELSDAVSNSDTDSAAEGVHCKPSEKIQVYS